MGAGQESFAGLAVYDLPARLEVGTCFLAEKWSLDPLDALGCHRLPPGVPAASTGADGAGKCDQDRAGSEQDGAGQLGQPALVLATHHHQGPQMGTALKGKAPAQENHLSGQVSPHGFSLGYFLTQKLPTNAKAAGEILHHTPGSGGLRDGPHGAAGTSRWDGDGKGGNGCSVTQAAVLGSEGLTLPSCADAQPKHVSSL